MAPREKAKKNVYAHREHQVPHTRAMGFDAMLIGDDIDKCGVPFVLRFTNDYSLYLKVPKDYVEKPEEFLDLVKEQFRVAAGDSFSFSQEEVKLTGHAIECRINAESPNKNFAPCPGRITKWRQPEGTGVRVDTHCYSGYFVPPYYDSLLAKLITLGTNRNDAIGRMHTALASFVISGVETTIPFHSFILGNRGYLNGDVNTRWLEDRLLKEYERNEGD